MFYPSKGAANAHPEWGPIDFTYVLIISSCVPETYRLKNTNIIRLFEILKMLYPPKGAANADPEWGPIDFYYVLIILSCVLETYLGVSKCALLSAF